VEKMVWHHDSPLDSLNPFLATDLDQREVLGLLDALIRQALTGADWENLTVFMFQDAMSAWLLGQQEPARDSLERRLIGHLLFPPGDFAGLPDYLMAIRRRTGSPYEDWPTYLEHPQPSWHLVGKALWAGCHYE
jgi:hypothetical protein